MSELITYQDNEARIVNMCKRIRRLAKLDRMSLVISEHQGPRTIHLFKYINYCGVDKQTFVKNYLSNLQPYMLSRNTKWEEADNALCVIDKIYRISMHIKLDPTPRNEIAISFHEDYKCAAAKDSSCLYNYNTGKIKIIADSLTGGIIDTNTKTFNVLISRGLINIPVSLAGELQADGTLIIQRSEIDNALLNVCSQYIQDLYASDLDYPSLNETEVFSALQQIPFTSNGNSVFSNISVLIDNMSSQDGKVHKISAAFALETYVSHLILTADQKKELISLIQDKYSASSQKDLAIVINMLVDIIHDLDTESYVLTEDGQE